jgi:hypothetical protein
MELTFAFPFCHASGGYIGIICSSLLLQSRVSCIGVQLDSSRLSSGLHSCSLFQIGLNNISDVQPSHISDILKIFVCDCILVINVVQCTRVTWWTIEKKSNHSMDFVYIHFVTQVLWTLFQDNNRLCSFDLPSSPSSQLPCKTTNHCLYHLLLPFPLFHCNPAQIDGAY